MARRRPGRRVLLVTGSEANHRHARQLIDSGQVPIRNPWFLREAPADGPDWTAVADLDADDALDRVGPVDLVVALDGAGVLPAARLRAARGLPGARPVDVLTFRDKEILHRGARAVGVPTTRRLTPEAARHWHFRTPLAVRARGRSGVRRVASADELPVGPDLIHEEWVDAEICHVDGIALGGRLVFAAVGRYLGTCYDFAAGAGTGGVTLADAEARAVLAAAELAVRALSVPDGAVHVELADAPAGPVLLDVAVCPPDALLQATTRAATGVDLMAEHIRTGIGQPSWPRRRRADAAGYWRVPRGRPTPAVRATPTLPQLRGEVTLAELPTPGQVPTGEVLAAVVVRHPSAAAVLGDLLALRERLEETVHTP